MKQEGDGFLFAPQRHEHSALLGAVLIPLHMKSEAANQMLSDTRAPSAATITLPASDTTMGTPKKSSPSALRLL